MDAAPDSSTPLPFPDGMLYDLLAVSLTGINVLRPVYSRTGELDDFAVVYLNPAAQRMTGLAERPGGTVRAHFPGIFTNGVFAFYRRVFTTEEAGCYSFNYQADGFDNYFHVAARRSAELLLVSFTDTSDQDRSPVEQALRASQAREQQARAEAEEQRTLAQAAQREAEFQRQRLYDFMSAVPGVVLSLMGPQHVIEFANEGFRQQFGVSDPVGKPYLEAVPGAANQHSQEYHATELYDHIYRTGQPYYAAEAACYVDSAPAGPRELRYFTIAVQAARDGAGLITGVQAYAFDVTGQVRARQQVEQLNQELEARVQERTHAALALQAEVLAAARQQASQRAWLYQVFEETPAAICIQRGPEHRYEYANAAYLAFFPGREVLGRPVAEVLPETVDSGVVDLLDHVYQTGETYYGEELPLLIAQPHGPPRQMYFTFTYQAYRENGEIVGISTFAYNVAEQVLARQQREAERQRLLHLFQEAPAGICILAGPELVYEFVNPRYQQLLPGRELQGRSIFETMPEIIGTPVESILRQVYATGQTHEAQGLHVPVARPADGILEDRYFTFVYQARRDEHGHVTGVLAFAFEVSEQVRARQREEESALQIRAIVEGVPSPINVSTGPDFRIELANQAMLAAWGKGPDVFGRPFADVLPELERQGIVAQFRQVLASGEPLHLRNQRLEVVIHGKPQSFHYNYSFVPLRNSRGQVYGILNTAHDVTDLALAHQRLEAFAAELRESEGRFRTMADAAPNMVWAVNPDASIRYINRAFLDFAGLRHEQQYIATGWAPYLHPDEAEHTQRTLAAAIAQRQPYVVEHRMRRHDGQYRWLLAQGAPSYLANGELYGYVGSAIDITDLKQANEQLRRTNADLDNFIYTASHDLKAPISNIEGLLYLLREELPPAVVAESETIAPTLTRMLDAVERFKRTIGHLTEVSKLQKEHAPAITAVSLAAVVADVRLDLAPLLRETNAHLQVDVADFPPILFPEKNLRSVVYNLLSNALKYRHPARRPHISVRGYLRPGMAVLEVHDNGLGLAENQLPKLFHMFQRFHDHVEGTGIGLYMVKRVVENAGGHLEVQSQLGAGSTFLVYLPHTPV